MRATTAILVTLALALTTSALACDKGNAAGEAPQAKAADDEAAAPAAAGKTTEPAETEAPAEEQPAPAANKEPAAPAPAAAPAAAANPALLDPSKATEQAPASYKVEFETTAGDFEVEVTREWSPRGADRFYNLVKVGYYDGCAFFRVIKGFMGQFGLHGDPKITSVWRNARIDDDPVKQSNTRGMITFATAGPDTRTTQLFINFGNNKNLDGMGFSPFGKISGDGMSVVDAIHNGYGEGAPRGTGPSQGLIQQQGNAYLKAKFPNLDYIKTARLVE